MSRYGTTRSAYGREVHPGALVRREPIEDVHALSREIEQELNPDENDDSEDGWIVL
ncbi:hypothetical protein [Streptomyces sp. V4I2]|uniref:hypothetical protein n=1 Tax=Streptomyces sp. V4I2 TaxID=3042280 RepID=UPI00277E26A6|nr:hypothetical protein [Streptomyces sp. V4I2]MDQ1044309.1 hypothetical protein [Streptomyces sp. V4I2]